MSRKNTHNLLFAAVVFLLPFIVYGFTASNALMFDDAAEFGLVIRLASIAHPPGTPSYIFFGHLWDLIGNAFSFPSVFWLSLFSAASMSLSGLLLGFTFLKILNKINPDQSLRNYYPAALTALGFCLSATTWSWGNTIEVYAFQCLAFACCLFGLTSYNLDRKSKFLLFAAMGIGLGLSNHHVTMILFLPFVPFFFLPGLFVPVLSENKKKKIKEQSPGTLGILLASLRSKDFLLLTAISALVTILFYVWLFIRAQHQYAFMFGQPDTWERFFYHLSGGAYTKNITESKGGMLAARFPYFIKLTVMQFSVFLPFLIAGFLQLVSTKRKTLALISLGYFLILFVYQLNNNQWASTDAYMLLPFMFLMPVVLIGLNRWIDHWKISWILPVLIIIQSFWLYPTRDRKSYPVDQSLMHLLDVSSPPNSIVLISDWTTVMQYYYHRYINGFRKDLTVLNYDIKFTNYNMLINDYPDFYQEIKPEYDKFIDELAKEHPQQITSTGCDLSTTPLLNAFRTLVLKIESVAKSSNRAFLTDPRAHVFYTNEKIYNPSRYVSGCFMSSIPGDSISASEFLKLDLPFLESPFLVEDPGALDKLVDFQAMLDQHIAFYKTNNFQDRLSQAEIAHDRIMKLQRDMKKSMSFAYKIY